jgi:hypothetical protein
MKYQPHRILAGLSLVVAPLLLAAINLFHPAEFTTAPGMSAFLSHPQSGDPHFNAIAYFGPQWWFVMHMMQTPLIVMVSFGLLYLTDTFSAVEGARFAWWARISRVATVIFMTYYTLLDGVDGIGVGRQLMVINEKLATAVVNDTEAEAIRRFLDHMWVDPWVGGVGSFISLTGSWAVFVAAVTAAGYLILNRRTSWLVFALLIGFGWELQVTHASYHGPVAFSLLALAAALQLTRKDPTAAR